MIFKRAFLALAALCFGLSLGACTQFSGAVADHWPHLAGGEPGNVPPRPGSPGYQEYIAHRQAEGAIPGPAAPGGAVAAPAQSSVAAAPPPAAQGSSPAPTGDTAIARGGLY
jgi:hypothetical protein